MSVFRLGDDILLHINEVIVVEGRFDRERLRRITDAPIICTDGFEIYRSDALLNSIRAAAKDRGVIILTDSDGAGFRIRNYLKQCLGEEKVRHAYIPRVEGKEKRKRTAGKEGILGVEGIDDARLTEILSRFANSEGAPVGEKITKQTFYDDGLSGGADSAARRRALARILNLPPRISANAMIDILNKAYGFEKYKEALEMLDKDKNI